MKKADDLRKLKGIGDVLAKRLVDNGMDTYAKIAAAGEEGLKKIPGVQPRLLQSIIDQAASLAGDSAKAAIDRVEHLRQQTVSLKDRIHSIGLGIKGHLAENNDVKKGAKLQRQLIKLMTSLEKVEVKVDTKPRKTGKALDKAAKRLDFPADTTLKKIGKGMKRARKALRRAIA